MSLLEHLTAQALLAHADVSAADVAGCRRRLSPTWSTTPSLFGRLHGTIRFGHGQGQWLVDAPGDLLDRHTLGSKRPTNLSPILPP